MGDYDNGGREWRPSGKPERVQVHDFPDPEMGKAVPYGVCDVGANEGWVSVGDDGDTAAFAVESIRRWWRSMGTDCYPDARLLITADAGGSKRLSGPGTTPATSGASGARPLPGDQGDGADSQRQRFSLEYAGSLV